MPLATILCKRTMHRFWCRREGASIPLICQHLFSKDLVREELLRLEESAVHGALAGRSNLGENARTTEGVAAWT